MFIRPETWEAFLACTLAYAARHTTFKIVLINTIMLPHALIKALLFVC